MSPPFVLRYAAKSIIRRKRKNALSFVGILLGVILLVSIGTVLESASRNFKDLAIRATGNADISITSAVGKSFPIETLQLVRSMANITDAAGRVEGRGTVSFWNQTAGQEYEEDVSVIGVAQGDYDYMDERYTKIEGRRVLERNEVIVDSRFGLGIGDTMKIRVLGEYYELKVAGVYLPPPLLKGLGEIGKRIYIDLPMAQRIFKTYGRLTMMIAKIRDFRDVDRVVERLEGELGYRYKVSAVRKQMLQQIEELMEGYSIDSLLYAIIAFTIAAVLIFNMQYMNAKGRIYEIGTLRSFGMTMNQVFLMLISEAAFIGVIASIAGALIGTALAIYMAEAFISPAATLILSSPETAPAAEYVKIVFSETYLKAGVVVGPLIAVIAAIVPSLMTSRENIIETVRGGRSADEKWLPIFSAVLGLILLWGANQLSKIRDPGTTLLGISAEILPMFSLPAFILGGVALAVGCLRIYAVLWRYLSQPILGRLGGFASKSIRRNMTRTAVSLSLICVALTFYMVAEFEMGSMDISIEKNMKRLFPADIVVFSEERIPADFHKKIQNLGGGRYVEFVTATISFETRLRVPDGRAGNFSAPMMGIDVRSFPKVMDVKLSTDTPPSVYYELMQPNTVILSRAVASSLGDLRRGSAVEILSAERVLAAGQIFYVPIWRRFSVIGIAEANPGAIFAFGAPGLGDPCYVSYSTLTGQFGNVGDYANVFFIEVRDEYKNRLAHVKDEIKRRFEGRYPVGIMTREDLLQDLDEHIAEELAMYEVMKISGFIVCVLGIAVTTNMNVDDRKREIAILRSMGASYSQLAMMILVEVIAVTVLGLAVSIPIAVKLYQVIVDWVSLWGFEMVYFLSFTPIQIAITSAFMMGVLGAVYPTYKAMRLSIIETLRRDI